MKMLLPVLLALVGLVGGAAAGWFLKPAPPVEDACVDENGEALDPEACADMKAQAEEEALAEPAPAAEESIFIE